LLYAYYFFPLFESRDPPCLVFPPPDDLFGSHRKLFPRRVPLFKPFALFLNFSRLVFSFFRLCVPSPSKKEFAPSSVFPTSVTPPFPLAPRRSFFFRAVTRDCNLGFQGNYSPLNLLLSFVFFFTVLPYLFFHLAVPIFGSPIVSESFSSGGQVLSLWHCFTPFFPQPVVFFFLRGFCGVLKRFCMWAYILGFPLSLYTFFSLASSLAQRKPFFLFTVESLSPPQFPQWHTSNRAFFSIPPLPCFFSKRVPPLKGPPAAETFFFGAYPLLAPPLSAGSF